MSPSPRTIEVDLEQDYTAIVELDEKGRAVRVLTSSTPGPTLVRIIDPDGGGPDFDRDDVLERIIEEGL